MNIEFRKITEFPRGTLVALLKDGYSFEPKFEHNWYKQWQEFDDFFYDNPHIAEFSGFMTVLKGKPIGFVSWNPTNLPESTEVGHNCILTKYKGNGYGKRQMREAVQRIISQGAKKIVVWTNEICVPAQHTYESAGFQFVKISEETFSEYAGERIHYEIIVNSNLWRRPTMINLTKFQWTRQPLDYKILENKVEIITKPHTDLWQKTYYHFQNDNAPVFQMETDEKFFSFVVKACFEESHHRFDQCGIVMYLDSENWLKGSIEYENDEFQHLGSVVTNNGYSDWATTEISADVKSMWYRLSRREDDYCIECSEDGIRFKQMRVCHMQKGGGKIQFGIYACSPENSSFKAVFTDMKLTECMWKAHDGQQPD